jgi:hypothetical protein
MLALLLLLLVFPLVEGCERVDNTFVVNDVGGSVASAELRLCGSRVELSRSGHRLRGTKRISCEGEGDIVVRLSDGRRASCHIGYVTPGAEQSFEFNVEGAQCLTGVADRSPP